MATDRNVLTQKIALYPLGDKDEVNRVYEYIRNGMYAQNKAYNLAISNLFSAIYSGRETDEINLISKKASRKPKADDPDYSLYEYGAIDFPTGLPIPGNIGRMVKQDLQKAKSDGLFKGKTSLPIRRLNAALEIPSAYFSFYHEYDSLQELEDHLYEKDLTVYMKFVNHIRFKIIFGNPYQSRYIRSMIYNVLDGTFEPKGSSLCFDKSNKKIILNLTVSVPKKTVQLDDDKIVGVALGVGVPAACSLNVSDQMCQVIGSREEFLDARLRMQMKRRKMTSALKLAKGGHGRKKKLAALDNLVRYEKNFAKTYNHMISKRIVEFAVENHAKYIHIEDPEQYPRDVFLLRNWSVYQLRSMIEYKADRVGIEVKEVSSGIRLPESILDDDTTTALRLAQKIAATPA